MAARSFAREGAPARDLLRMGALPLIAFGALAGILGIYWDIAWHIDKGRDSFFTPPHDFIYASMLVTVAAAVWILARDRRGTHLHLRVGRARLHPGALVVAVGAAAELLFAPADELWHRLFGADVTLWAPMHLIGVTGLTTLAFGGLVSSEVERRLATDPARARVFGRWSVGFGSVLLAWGMLLLAEYEFSLPSFPLLWQPLLLIGLPPFALLLLARLRPVPWAATWTAAGFTLLRLALAAGLIGTSALDLAGVTRPAIPVLLLAGVVADGLARRAPGWLAGPAVGAAALAATWPVVAIGPLDPYPAALAVAIPAGLALAALTGALAGSVADALGPRPGQGEASGPRSGRADPLQRGDVRADASAPDGAGARP